MPKTNWVAVVVLKSAGNTNICGKKRRHKNQRTIRNLNFYRNPVHENGRFDGSVQV